MSQTEFSDDPITPLNQKIAELTQLALPVPIEGSIKRICREIYDMAFEDGQAFVYTLRSGMFDKIEITEEGRKLGLTEDDFKQRAADCHLEGYHTVTIGSSPIKTRWLGTDEEHNELSESTDE